MSKNKEGFWNGVWNDYINSKWTKLGWLPGAMIGSLIVWFITDTGNKIISWKNVWIVIGIIASWYLLVFLLLLLKHLFNFIHNSFVNSLYGEVVAQLTSINSQLKELNSKEVVYDNELMKVLKKVCNELKHFFDKKTHAKCGVSIKVTLSKDAHLESWKFKNLCRDDKNTNRDTEKYQKTDHTVVGNTPYTYVVNQLLKHSSKVAYINNNIPNTNGYLNTSKFDENTELPYKSELVYPIKPLIQRGDIPEMCGFICIDCDKTDKFDEKRYDVSIIENIVDNLFELLTKVKNN